MQFNLVNDQEQLRSLSGVAWRGVAYRRVVGHGVSVRVYCKGCLKRL